MNKKICVCGAGTMGAGIALQVALSGFDTIIFDVDPQTLQRAQVSINNNLQQLLSKNKIDEFLVDITLKKIKFTSLITDCIADIIIEAIIENKEAKIQLFKKLDAFNNKETIFLTNTSSLSITSIQKNIDYPDRFAGLHFFNPAHLMKLVEVVKGEFTSPEVIEEILRFCASIKKSYVQCLDSPGFIVNRIARHYYLEALKIIEKGLAPFTDVDDLMEASGFKLGPFKLMDLIGMDINFSVTQQLYESYDRPLRFLPSIIQSDLVKQGKLGRKTGQGFYKY